MTHEAQGDFAVQLRQLGTGHAVGEFEDAFLGTVFRAVLQVQQRPQVFQAGLATVQLQGADFKHTVDAPGPGECGVKLSGAVGCEYMEDAAVSLKTINF